MFVQDKKPVHIAGTFLLIGMPVYLDSNKKWQQAVSVTDPTATKTNATHIAIQDAAAGDAVEGADRVLIGGYIGLTSGGVVYLSATAGTVTQTQPALKYQQQRLGVAVSATEIMFDVEPVPVESSDYSSVGANANTAGSGVVLGPTAATSAVMRVYADDNGVALPEGAYRAAVHRALVTGAYTASVSIFGAQGQLKVVGTTGGVGKKAGQWCYLETASGAHLGGQNAACYAMADLVSGAVIDASAVLSGVLISSDDLGGTHTGIAAAISMPNPSNGTWDYMLALGAAPGFTDAAAHGTTASGRIAIMHGSTVKYIHLFTD